MNTPMQDGELPVNYAKKCSTKWLFEMMLFMGAEDADFTGNYSSIWVRDPDRVWSWQGVDRLALRGFDRVFGNGVAGQKAQHAFACCLLLVVLRGALRLVTALFGPALGEDRRGSGKNCEQEGGNTDRFRQAPNLLNAACRSASASAPTDQASAAAEVRTPLLRRRSRRIAAMAEADAPALQIVR